MIQHLPQTPTNGVHKIIAAVLYLLYATLVRFDRTLTGISPITTTVIQNTQRTI